mmetsp:Transcript_45217/g.72513  ORF Transcript_45217/g.72513 Transcript_45217/m.72513 type:complete len:494 (+) Transcript_45217:247-1728(+)
MIGRLSRSILVKRLVSAPIFSTNRIMESTKRDLMQQPDGSCMKKRKTMKDFMPAKAQPLVTSNGESDNQKAFENDIEMIIQGFTKEIELKNQLEQPVRDLKLKGEKVVRAILCGEDCDFSQCKTGLEQVFTRLETCPSWMRTMASTQNCITTVIAAHCLIVFFETGKLCSMKSFSQSLHPVNRTEYLLGVIRFLDELEVYAIGRAMYQDMRSVQICSWMVSAVFTAFTEFNFRNGTLRRRYDSIKYRVRKLENMQHELSLVLGPPDGDLPDFDLIDQDEFKFLAEEEDKFTDIRDKVIKSVRQPQKDSKKAIYSLHRNNPDEARTLLASALIASKEVEELAKSCGSQELLESGSYSGLLEEYAEARIFEEWILDKTFVMPYSSLKKEINISEQDYIGGLVDFTGELGRFGISEATQRNVDGVKQILATMLTVKGFILQMQESVSSKMAKKGQAVFTNTRKMENTLYELLLVTKSNRKTISLESTQVNEETHAE